MMKDHNIEQVGNVVARPDTRRDEPERPGLQGLADRAGDVKSPRRSFLRLGGVGALGMMLGARPSLSQSSSQLSGQPPRRFIIDSHQHYQPAPDYVERLVKVYRRRNAMACVLTPMAGFEVIKKAAADHPDVVIPYGHVNVDDPNVVFDLTGSSLIKKSKNLAVFKEYLWWEGPTAHSSPDAVYAFEKLVFGTDEAPENLDACVARYEAMLEACGAPEASRKKIYGETLAKILGIKVRD